MIELTEEMVEQELKKRKVASSRPVPAVKPLVKPTVDQKRLDKFEEKINKALERGNERVTSGIKKAEARAEAYKSRIGKLENRLNEIEKELKRSKLYEAKLLKILDKPDRFVKGLQSSEERMVELGGRLQSYLNRESVLTEVSRYVRRMGSADLIVSFHLKLMQAYNWGDEFWEQHGSGSFTLLEWFDKIMEVEDIAFDSRAESAMAAALAGSIS